LVGKTRMNETTWTTQARWDDTNKIGLKIINICEMLLWRQNDM
jgi:hypothetical protein